MKIYLASPFDTEEKRENALKAKRLLKDKQFDVYLPLEHAIPNAWDYPNAEWGAMVFAQDIAAIEGADIVVALSYGRESTAGTNFEIGYAFAKGKKVILVEMTDNIMSLMVANGRYATVKGLTGLRLYNFYDLPKLRTETEVK